MSTSPRTRATQVGGLAFIAIALLCAAFAAFLVNRMITAKGYTGDRVRPVVVALRALQAAQPITPDDVHVVNWPEKSMPGGTVSSVKTLFADNQILIPTTAILEGEPIVPSRLASSTQGTGLAALVREGYRAVAVRVDDSVGRAKLVYPGAFVDVIATIRDTEGRGSSSRIAVPDVKVLAVEAETDVATRASRARQAQEQGNNQAASQNLGSTVVTLEVSPEDAEVLAVISRTGTIDLALRNGSDRKPVETRGAIPMMFSAWAPDVAVEPGDAEGAPGKPRIQLRAVDSRRETRDNPERASEIETYRAR
jgi:pilus assembly protein CpaB